MPIFTTPLQTPLRTPWRTPLRTRSRQGAVDIAGVEYERVVGQGHTEEKEHAVKHEHVEEKIKKIKIYICIL